MSEIDQQMQRALIASGIIVENLSSGLEIEKMRKALRYLADNPNVHPVNVQVIAKDALGES